MGVSYDVFTKAFLEKITEYDFLTLDPDTTTSIIDGYMARACSQFNRICKYDLTIRDDVLRIFDIDISLEDIDEIADIISEGMVVQWLKPYTFKSENLENVLNTADYTMYSPAELLLRITNAYKMAQRDFRNMCFDYSYNHGDLGSLSL